MSESREPPSRSLVEQRLEAKLESHLPRLIAPYGHEILVIGRQVPLGPGLRVDLLLIGRNGDTYATEVKGYESDPQAVGQGLSYRRAVRALNREDLISIARDYAGMNLARTFRERLGRPLPTTLNRDQNILIIGYELSEHTARSVAELREHEGTAIHAFRFDERHDSVGLIPCARDDIDLVASSHRHPAKPRAPHITPRRVYTPRSHVREFWSGASARFTSPIVTVASIYSQYEAWIAAAPLPHTDAAPLPLGAFSRQLRSVVHDEGAWRQVFLRPKDDIDPFRWPTLMPPAQFKRDVQFRISAYLRRDHL